MQRQVGEVEILEAAGRIRDMFLTIGADSEVNISSGLRAETLKQLEAAKVALEQRKQQQPAAARVHPTATAPLNCWSFESVTSARSWPGPCGRKLKRSVGFSLTEKSSSASNTLRPA